MTKTHKRIIWIVIRTEMYMTKTHIKTYTNMDIQSTKLYMTKTYNRVNSTRKMMKLTHNDKGQCDIMND